MKNLTTLRIYFYLFILSTVPIMTYAQVGINTTNPKDGSILDVYSINKGVFIPKVDIASLNSIDPITGIDPANLANAEGLLVYNENTSTGPGFFFWNGTLWQSLGGSDSGDDWKISGNAGGHFFVELDKDVTSKGTVIIPRGTIVQMEVLVSENKKRRASSFGVTVGGFIIDNFLRQIKTETKLVTTEDKAEGAVKKAAIGARVVSAFQLALPLEVNWLLKSQNIN